MVTTIMIVTYIWNLFFIKHNWLHIVIKFWACIANIKRMRAYKFWTISRLKQILTIFYLEYNN